MSVIVKGMEMPKNCQECWLYIEGACYAKGYRDYRRIMDTAKPDDCPLVELPEKHGRLIDIRSVEDGKFVTVGNATHEYPRTYLTYKDGYDGEYPNIANVDDCLDAIKYADTVIEAEGSET